MDTMKVLRYRDLDHFTYLLVRCRCGERFGQRADRRVVACLACGRMSELARVWPAPAALKPAAVVEPAVRRRAASRSSRHVMRAATAGRRRRARR